VSRDDTVKGYSSPRASVRILTGRGAQGPRGKGRQHDRCVEFVPLPGSIASIWRRSITWGRDKGGDRAYRLSARSRAVRAAAVSDAAAASSI